MHGGVQSSKLVCTNGLAMANETLETRIARIERLVRWLAYTVAVAIAIALAAVAALIVQTLYFHASIDAHWHWQSALSFLGFSSENLLSLMVEALPLSPAPRIKELKIRARGNP